MGMSSQVHEREIYDLLALIGDCGGLYGGLLSIFQSLIFLSGFLGDKAFSSFLVTSIFSLEPFDENRPRKRLRKRKMSKLSYCFSPCGYSVKERRVLDEGVKRIEKMLDMGNFLVKFSILWDKLKSEVPKRRLAKMRFAR